MATKRENVLPDYRVILLVVVGLSLIYLLLPILSPFLIAAILAYVCSPLVDKLDKVRLGKFTLGRSVSTILVMLLLFGVLALLLLIVVPLLQKELLLLAERLPQYIAALRNRLEPWLELRFGLALDIDIAELRDMLGRNWESASGLVGGLLKTVSNHGMAFIGWLLNLVLVPVVLFYLLRDWHALVKRVAQLLPRRWFDRTATIAHEIDLVLAEFLRGQLSVMLLMSVFYAVGLGLTGLELAIPVALIAGLLTFVPYLGVTIGILLALLAGALQFSSPTDLIPVLAVFAVAQMVEGFVLTPWLVGDRTGLHPVVVIFALLAGGELFGFSGILLALPVCAAIAVGLRHAKREYLASDLYLK